MRSCSSSLFLNLQIAIANAIKAVAAMTLDCDPVFPKFVFDSVLFVLVDLVVLVVAVVSLALVDLAVLVVAVVSLALVDVEVVEVELLDSVVLPVSVLDLAATFPKPNSDR